MTELISPSARPDPRKGVGRATRLLAAAVCCAAGLGIASSFGDGPFRDWRREYEPREIRVQGIGRESGLMMVTTGVRRHKTDSARDALDFVVIQSRDAPGELESRVRVTSSSADYESSAALRLRDRTIPLPDRAFQLFQIENGTFTAVKAKATPQEWEAYLDRVDHEPDILDFRRDR